VRKNLASAAHLTGLLVLVLITLKLTGRVGWSWWWVWTPLWFWAAVGSLVALAGLVFYLFTAAFLTVLGWLSARDGRASSWPRTRK
jgi:hypothetical protein